MNRIMLGACSMAALPFGLAGCGGDEAVLEVSYSEVILKAFRAVPQGLYAMRSQADWDALWMSSPAQFSSDPFPSADKSTPVFDFQREMLLVLSLGVGVRCYLPQIVRISDQGGVRRVQWKTNQDTGVTTSACNYPYPLVTLVLAAASSAEVQFFK